MLSIPFREATQAWARGRDPWSRGTLLLVLLWIFQAYLRDTAHSSIFDGLNLVVHEAGHMFFFWFGEFPGMAGGTIFELAIPVLVGIAFFRQKDFFGIAVVLFWLGTALFHVGVYAADARSELLGLVSMGAGEPIHDWHYLLSRLGLLEQDHLLGNILRILGTLSMATALAWGGWMVRFMMGNKNTAQG